MSLALSAGVAVMDDKLPTALEQFAEAIEHLEDLGSADDIAYLLLRQAVALDRSGDKAGARAALRRSNDLADQRGSASIMAMTEFAMVQQLDDPMSAEARDLILASIRRAETAPHMAAQAIASMYCMLARVEREAGNLPAASKSRKRPGSRRRTPTTCPSLPSAGWLWRA